MKFGKTVLSAAIASSLVAAPTMAAAAPAERTASPAAGEELAGAGSLAWIIAVLVAAGVIAVIVSDEDEDAPTSP